MSNNRLIVSLLPNRDWSVLSLLLVTTLTDDDPSNPLRRPADDEAAPEPDGGFFRVVLGVKEKAGSWVAKVLDSVTRSRSRQREERHERKHEAHEEHRRHDTAVSRWEDEGGAL